jgi:hypothetical protein
MSEPAKDFDLEHWKEVCYAHEVELECLRAENDLLREALREIAEKAATPGYAPEQCRSIWWMARAALSPSGQKERRAKALSELAEMDADLLDIDPEVKP